MEKTLKQKKISLADTNHGLSCECYDAKDVGEAVKKSERNNKVWLDIIYEVTRKLDLTEKQEFDINNNYLFITLPSLFANFSISLYLTVCPLLLLPIDHNHILALLT